MSVESTVCDACQDVCYHIEAWGHDIAGTGEKVCLLYREHFPSRSGAMHVLTSWLLQQARQIKSAEERAWVIEHQGVLFPDDALG